MSTDAGSGSGPLPTTGHAQWLMPPSVPAGMRLELSRARLLAGAQVEADRWMSTLHRRYAECLATLAGEKMSFEATFRHTDADGTEWLYHLSLFGEGGGQFDVDHPVNQAHLDYARRCKEPGWEELQPVLLLMPDAVRTAVVECANGPTAAPKPASAGPGLA